MINLPEADTDEYIFKVGKVLSVNGRSVRVLVDTTKNGSFLAYKGETVKNVSVGGFVKVIKGFMEIVGKVNGERIERVEKTVLEYGNSRDNVARVLEVSLLGYFEPDGTFRHGVRELPLIDNDCFLLNHSEFDQVHRFVVPPDQPLRIGTLPMEGGFDLSVGVDALFSSHIGIFGNTGSGKSHTLASLYHRLFADYSERQNFNESARFVLIDFNGEYVDNVEPGATESTEVIWASKCQYRLSTRTDNDQALPFPRATLEAPEFWEILLDATEKTQAPFLRRALRNDFWNDCLDTYGSVLKQAGWLIFNAIKDGRTAQDRAHIFHFLEELQRALRLEDDTEMTDYIFNLRHKLDFNGTNDNFYYQDGMTKRYPDSSPEFFRNRTVDDLGAIHSARQVEDDIHRISLKFILQYYTEIFRGYANSEHLGPVVKRLENRIPAIRRVIKVDDTELLKETLTVVSLRDVSLDMKKVIPLLLCGHLYKDHKEHVEARGHLNLIIDEAHTILSETSNRETEAWKDYRLETFEEIIKEGRKFGVFMTIASQRPHDISETIVSQLHTYFLHRLINHLDIRAIERAVAYLDPVSFEALPILPTGTCIMSGLAARVPVMLAIDELDSKSAPNSRTDRLTTRWLLNDDPVTEPTA